jgi:phospholipid N-methyltransferase
VKKGRLVIVEYGPGTGVLAEALLTSGRLSSDSLLILIETNEEFVSHLRSTLKDPRVSVFHTSAEHVCDVLAQCGERGADYIFSSIPLTLMPDSTVTDILRATNRALTTDGRFIVFLVRFIRTRTILRKQFPVLRITFEPASLPPMVVFEATKNCRK